MCHSTCYRIHAEFQLNKPPLHPFWFTPAQFSGRLIINRDATIVKFFHMSVPERNLNVGMELILFIINKDTILFMFI